MASTCVGTTAAAMHFTMTKPSYICLFQLRHASSGAASGTSYAAGIADKTTISVPSLLPSGLHGKYVKLLWQQMQSSEVWSPLQAVVSHEDHISICCCRGKAMQAALMRIRLHYSMA